MENDIVEDWQWQMTVVIDNLGLGKNGYIARLVSVPTWDVDVTA